jgi:hypothetical protein
MADLTSSGLVVNRYPEIKQIIQQGIQANAAASISFDEDLILTQIVNILATEMAQYEEVLQALYSSLDRDKAEGAALDSLLFLVGLTRNGATKTSGFIEVVTGDGSNIPFGTVVENPSSKDRFLTTQAILSTVTACTEARYTVDDTPANTLITVNINGTDYTYTTGGSPTEESIVDGIIGSVPVNSSIGYTASKSLEPVTLVITSKTDDNISVDIQQYLVPLSSRVLVPVESQVDGAIKAPAYSVTETVTPIPNIIALQNVSDFGVGRLRETDTEFRTRATQTLAVSGSSTYAAMLAAMSNLSEVSNVLIEENETSTTNALGLPPHSFEVIVNAQDTPEIDNLIATTIFEEKPLGIQTHGNNTVTIVDSTGKNRDISFSRPTAIIVATRITYSLYSEEQPTPNIQEVMKQAIVDYGAGLSSGKDVIPRRFIGGLYSNTTGLDSVTVEMQIINNSGDTPVELDWSENTIPILPSEYSVFNSQDISFVEV